MTQTWMKKDEAIKIWIIRVEVPSLVEGVVILDKGTDLHFVADSVLDDSAERITWGAVWQGILRISICHTLRANKDEVEGDAREEETQLLPHFSWERRLCPGTQYEESDWWWVWPDAFHRSIGASPWRM